MDDLKEVPRRRDGSFKSFWYDRDYPGHIMHRTDTEDGGGIVRTLCVGHGEQPYKAHR